VLIHPWDAATDPSEWHDWLVTTGRFGFLAVGNIDPLQAPLLLATHFTLLGDELLLHLARPNPVWPHLEAAAEVRLAVAGDYAYIPGYWRAKPGQPPEHGVPTSYYATVQFVCRPTVVDDPQLKADVLNAQLADFQPEGIHDDVSVDSGPFERELPGIRAARLEILRVEAKFKYDDHKPVEHRERVISELEARAEALDSSTAAQQRRRLAAIGDWRSSRPRE
jgi:transcriptional regulator